MKNATRRTSAAGMLLAGLIVVGAGCGQQARVEADLNVPAPNALGLNAPSGPQERQLMVALEAQNGSGIMGKAVLIEQGDKTKVMINVNGTTQGQKYPAHVHLGSCPTPGNVQHPLASLTEGKSVTVIDASFDDLLAGLPLAINLHKSETELSAYVSCGDLKAADVMPKDPGVEAMMSSSAAMKPEEGTAAGEARTTVTLRPIGSLAASGTATIEEDDGKTKVTIKLTGLAGTHPASIRNGMCPNPGEIKHKLSDVVEGKSTTVIDAKIGEAMAGGQLAVDVRAAATDTASLLCGDLPLWDAAKMMFKI